MGSSVIMDPSLDTDPFIIRNPTTNTSTTSSSGSTTSRPTTIGSRSSSLGSLIKDVYTFSPLQPRSARTDPELSPESSPSTKPRILKRQILTTPSRLSSRNSSSSVAHPLVKVTYPGKPASTRKHESTDVREMQEKSYTKRICLDEKCPIESIHSADRFDLDRLAKEARSPSMDCLAESTGDSLVPKEVLEALERMRNFKTTEAYMRFKKDEEFLERCRRVHHRWGY